MTIHSLYIINKAGGLIYNKDFSEGLTRLSSNEYLVLAGTFHGIHAITARLCPFPTPSTHPPEGLDLLECAEFNLHCFQTLTGLKFLLLTSKAMATPAETVLRKIYEIYSDFAMKNPFYTPEMPIRVDGFDKAVAKCVSGA